MFRFRALGGVSVAAIQATLLASADMAHAQNGEPGVLPPVSVEAPRPAKPAARKPVNRSAVALRHRTAPAAAAAPNRPVVVSAAGAGAHA